MREEGWKDTGRGINDEGTSTTDNYNSAVTQNAARQVCYPVNVLLTYMKQKIFQLCISTVQRLAAKLINKQAMQF